MSDAKVQAKAYRAFGDALEVLRECLNRNHYNCANCTPPEYTAKLCLEVEDAFHNAINAWDVVEQVGMSEEVAATSAMPLAVDAHRKKSD